MRSFRVFRSGYKLGELKDKRGCHCHSGPEVTRGDATRDTCQPSLPLGISDKYSPKLVQHRFHCV